MTRDPELPLGFHLGREAVAVPPETALDSPAADCLVPGHGIFDETRQQVPVMRNPFANGGPS